MSKNFNPSQTSHGHPLAKSYLYFPLCVLLLISPYHVIKAQFRQPQHRSLVPSLLRRPRRNQNKSKRASLIARHSKIQLLLSYLLFILNNFKSYAGEWSLWWSYLAIFLNMTQKMEKMIEALENLKKCIIGALISYDMNLKER